MAVLLATVLLTIAGAAIAPLADAQQTTTTQTSLVSWSTEQLVLLALAATLLLLILRTGIRRPDTQVHHAIAAMCENPVERCAGATVSVHDVSHRYGGNWALASIDTTLDAGSLVAVIGGDGAGKSTLLKVLSGSETPTAGDVQIRGVSMRHSPRRFRHQVGVVARQPLLYAQLTISENLRFFAELFNLSQAETNDAIAYSLGQVGLLDERNEKVAGLSLARQQRVAIARSLLHAPGVVMLDEPYVDLDSPDAMRLDLLLLDLSHGGNTVVFTADEYSFDRAFQIADRILVLHDGRLVNDLDVANTSQAEAELVYREMFEAPRQPITIDVRSHAIIDLAGIDVAGGLAGVDRAHEHWKVR